jgi:hypothetical protein
MQITQSNQHYSRGETNIRKIFKIILSLFALLIIVSIASFSLIMFDVAGTFATDTHPLPNGAATQKAIVIYDPD